MPGWIASFDGKKLEPVDTARLALERALNRNLAARTGGRCELGKILQVVRSHIGVANLVFSDAIVSQIDSQAVVRENGVGQKGIPHPGGFGKDAVAAIECDDVRGAWLFASDQVIRRAVF